MAPETSVLNTAVQVRVMEDPMVPVGLGGVSSTDMVKLPGTEEESV